MRKNQKMSEEQKAKTRAAVKKYYEEHPEKHQIGNLSKENHPNWKGGVGNYQILVGKLYKMFYNIKIRCNDPSYTQYKDYGGRGIKNLFPSFEDFFNYITIELGITKRLQINGLMIDRIDNNGNYEPGNLHFVTPSESSYNRRNRRKFQ